MRALLRPVLLPLLRKNQGLVDEQARRFSVKSEAGRALVAGVGGAFLSGYNVMLGARGLGEVKAAGRAVEPRFSPFFFEGAAMGYLPRGYFTDGAGKAQVEAELLGMDPRFLYLYNVGLGFWFGFRHPSRPATLEALAPHVDPFYFPLCYDGYGFKVGFFDFPGRESSLGILDRAPANRRAEIYQGFGRSLHFVCMEDEDRFARAKAGVPAAYRDDVESGRSLAVAFTGINTPEAILRHLAAAADDHALALRLLGVTWALTAREMNDPDYFEQCLATLPPGRRHLLRLLSQRCREARERATSYAAWRVETQDAVMAVYSASEEVAPR